MFQIDEFSDLNKRKLENYLRRSLRKQNIRKPLAKKSTFIIDGSSQLRYFERDGIK
jgi:hypothetical protein